MKLKLKHPEKPSYLYSIKNDKWNLLSLKEKDLVILLFEWKHTREFICKKLYIETDQGFRYLCKKTRTKLDLVKTTMVSK